MNTRRKGKHTFAKSMRYALTFPGTVVIPLYQVSRWSTTQPFDMLLFRPTYPLILVEVRSNQWGVAKPQTKQLANLPGKGYFKQLWLFLDGCTIPKIRQWDETALNTGWWVAKESPWESAG